MSTIVEVDRAYKEIWESGGVILNLGFYLLEIIHKEGIRGLAWFGGPIGGRERTTLGPGPILGGFTL